jgi:hypothetical protein
MQGVLLMSWYVYDPEPVEGNPLLVGPFATRELAEQYANLAHDEDGSGNTVVLHAVKP